MKQQLSLVHNGSLVDIKHQPFKTCVDYHESLQPMSHHWFTMNHLPYHLPLQNTGSQYQLHCKWVHTEATGEPRSGEAQLNRSVWVAEMWSCCVSCSSLVKQQISRAHSVAQVASLEDSRSFMTFPCSPWAMKSSPSAQAIRLVDDNPYKVSDYLWPSSPSISPSCAVINPIYVTSKSHIDNQQMLTITSHWLRHS